MQIEFNCVTKYYHNKGKILTAVDGVSWQAQPGNIYGLIGPNGSGKTTLIRMLLDLIRPDRGEILINGSLLGNRDNAFKHSVGYLPEERGLYRNEQALDLLVYLAELKNIPRRAARERARQFMKELELEEFLHKPLSSFSKGMSQKIQLIAALLHEPLLTVLDEPFSGLDPVNVRLVREFIARRKAAGAVVLLCTHMMDEAERVCDQIVMLNNGRLIHCESQSSLRENFGRPRIVVRADPALAGLTTVATLTPHGNQVQVQLRAEASISDFLKELTAKFPQIKELEVAPASLEDIYIAAVQKNA